MSDHFPGAGVCVADCLTLTTPIGPIIISLPRLARLSIPLCRLIIRRLIRRFTTRSRPCRGRCFYASLPTVFTCLRLCRFPRFASCLRAGTRLMM